MAAPQKRLGFIGLGAMGKPMARNIAKRLDISVNLYDVRTEAMADSDEWGGIVHASPAEVAAVSDVIFTMLPADEHLRAAALGSDGIIESARDGLTLVDFSTLGPATIREVDAKFREKGARCLAAAVTLGVPRAIAGTLSVYVDTAVNEDEDLMAFVRGCSATVLPIGETGSAKVMKLVNNFLTGVSTVIISEVIGLGVKAGVPAETLFRLLMKGSGASYLMEKEIMETVPKGDMGPGRFSVDFMVKDLKLAQEMGRQHGHPSHYIAAALAAFNGARAYGHGNDYVGSVIRWHETAANMEPVGPTEKVQT